MKINIGSIEVKYTCICARAHTHAHRLYILFLSRSVYIYTSILETFSKNILLIHELHTHIMNKYLLLLNTRKAHIFPYASLFEKTTYTMRNPHTHRRKMRKKITITTRCSRHPPSSHLRKSSDQLAQQMYKYCRCLLFTHKCIH